MSSRSRRRPLLGLPAVASAAARRPARPGSAIRTTRTRGNGGYDVAHYGLDLSYQPSSNRLTGVATITARATQDLSTFNLDLEGLTVSAITVNGVGAEWRRGGGELVIDPAADLPTGVDFTTVISYRGVPDTLGSAQLGTISGFMHTDDGALIAGPAGGRRDLVPGQRPPARQGRVHVQGQRPQGHSR